MGEVVFQVLSNSYGGQLDQFLTRVEEVFGTAEMDCPILGRITLPICVTERHKPFTTANPHQMVLGTTKRITVKGDEFIIHLEIAGKQYPVKIRRGDERTEQRAREAAKRVQQMYLQRKAYFSKSLDDKDLLAMVAVQLAMDMIPLEEKNDTQPFVEKIQQWTERLEHYLKER